MRLALVRLLRALVALGGKSFGAYVGDAVAVLQAVCDDPFHEVQEEACAVVVELNGKGRWTHSGGHGRYIWCDPDG